MPGAVSYSSVVIDKFTDINSRTFKVTIGDFKLSRSSYASKSQNLKNPVSVTALLGGGNAIVDSEGKQINSMLDWVVARLSPIPGDETASNEALTKFANVSRDLVKNVKDELKRSLKKQTLAQDKLDDMMAYLPGILRLGDEPMDDHSRSDLRIPQKLIGTSDADVTTAEYLGVVLGNYLEDYFLQPTLMRVRFAQHAEIKASDVDYTRKLLSEQS